MASLKVKSYQSYGHDFETLYSVWLWGLFIYCLSIQGVSIVDVPRSGSR